jgi:uncharacterized protein (TIGR03067 family)
MFKSLLASLVWCAAVLGAQTGPGEARPLPAKELALLRGEWSIVAAEADGAKARPESLKKLKVRITDAKLILDPGFSALIDGDSEVMRPFLHEEPIEANIVRIDPSKSPKELDLQEILENGKPHKKKLAAIYSVQGETLRLSIGLTPPKRFATSPIFRHEDYGCILLTLKRHEPKK